MSDEEPQGEPVNTDVSLEALLRIFRDHADRALSPQSDIRRKYALENIRDVCDNILEDDD